MTKKLCRRCGYDWESKVLEPRQCPYCKSPKWALNRPGEPAATPRFPAASIPLPRLVAVAPESRYERDGYEQA